MVMICEAELTSVFSTISERLLDEAEVCVFEARRALPKAGHSGPQGCDLVEETLLRSGVVVKLDNELAGVQHVDRLDTGDRSNPGLYRLNWLARESNFNRASP